MNAPQTTNSTTVFKVFLFTDLVGSTDLKARLGDEAGARAIGAHNGLFRECLASTAGDEQDNAGDGFFATFDKPSDAVRCALAFVHRLPSLPTPEKLAVRVGIHMGEIVRMIDAGDAHGERLIGLAVDTAARVMSLALAGQILLTRHAFDSVRQQTIAPPEGCTVEWLAHGPYRFKGVAETVDVYEAGLIGVSPCRPPASGEKVSRAIAPGDDATLGWRPAVGLDVPGRPAWVVIQKLGEGGFGEVWLARHQKTRDLRTFKFCFQADRLRTLKRELTLFRLMKESLGERPDIVRLFDVRLDVPPYFLEMEYTAGGNLLDWSAARGGITAVPLPRRLELTSQIASALHAAHSVGVLHKDVKPANVLIHENKDGSVQARLTDFGIGQLLDPEQLAKIGITATGFGGTELTDLGSRTGTRLYMAPELLAGKPPSTQSDIYALGVLLYQMVVADLGRPLAQGWEADVDDELLREDIRACVIGSQEKRLTTADELVQRLRSIESRRADLNTQIKAASLREKSQRHRRVAWITMSALLLMLVSAIAVFWILPHSSPQSARKIALDRLMESASGFPRESPARAAENPGIVMADATITINLAESPKALNPLATDADPLICELIFEKLFWRTANLELVPNPHLVEAVEPSDDGRLITVRLRPDAQWHDGKHVTSADVIFSWNISGRKAIGKVERDSDSVARFTLVNPMPSWRMNINIMLLPEHIYARALEEVASAPAGKANSSAGMRPIGCGPFEFVSRASDSIRLKRAPSYSGNAPQFEGLVFRWVTDPDKAIASFRNKEFDLCGLTGAQYQDEIDTPEFKQVGEAGRAPSTVVDMIVWNTAQPSLFADARVRRAMAYALDLEQIRRRVTYNLAHICRGPWPEISECFDPNAPYPQFSRELADRLLDEAGWVRKNDGRRVRRDVAHNPSESPLEFTLLVDSRNDAIRRIAEIYQADLNERGVTVVVKPMDWKSIEDAASTRRFDAYVGALVQPVDPDLMRSCFYTGGSKNHGAYSNKKDVDRLFDLGSREMNQGKRAEIYKSICRLIVSDQPCTFLYNNVSFWAKSKRLQGVEFSVHRGPFGWQPSIQNWWVRKDK